MNMTISVAKDYSPFVLGRYESDSDYNGTGFRDRHLMPALKKLVKNDLDSLVVDLDGTFGCDPSFLEEAFGGMVRELNKLDIDFNDLWNTRVTIKGSNSAEAFAIDGYIKDAINAGNP
jgi:hypothetical protein